MDTRELAKKLKTSKGTKTAKKNFDARKRREAAAEAAKKAREAAKPTPRQQADKILAELVAKLKVAEGDGETVLVCMTDGDCGLDGWNNPSPDRLSGAAWLVYQDLEAAESESNWYPYVDSTCLWDNDHRLEVRVQYGEKHWRRKNYEAHRFDDFGR